MKNDTLHICLHILNTNNSYPVHRTSFVPALYKAPPKISFRIPYKFGCEWWSFTIHNHTLFTTFCGTILDAGTCSLSLSSSNNITGCVGLDLHQRPPPYEGGEMLLLYPAIKVGLITLPKLPTEHASSAPVQHRFQFYPRYWFTSRLLGVTKAFRQ